ncbi:hypothetical protein [Escherichia coli]|uniref:hypothetical protein n=1 Tax=Escherichia coli TaxID=562 RepID=UPI00201ED91B|nr:hypothetical protein [Escherichia coli]
MSGVSGGQLTKLEPVLDIYPSLPLILRYIYCLVFQGASSSFGFCQILGRYTMSLGWSKYWGVLGVLPVTNIVLFLILIFFKKR